MTLGLFIYYIILLLVVNDSIAQYHSCNINYIANETNNYYDRYYSCDNLEMFKENYIQLVNVHV